VIRSPNPRVLTAWPSDTTGRDCMGNASVLARDHSMEFLVTSVGIGNSANLASAAGLKGWAYPPRPNFANP
jgi:hypothetical protein